VLLGSVVVSHDTCTVSRDGTVDDFNVGRTGTTATGLDNQRRSGSVITPSSKGTIDQTSVDPKLSQQGRGVVRNDIPPIKETS
jgi:hypothetical protein